MTFQDKKNRQNNTDSRLRGQSILVTRPDAQARSWAAELRERGATVIVHPVIEIRPPANWQAVDDVLGRIASFDWVVFVSTNGVEFFLRRCQELGVDLAGAGRLAAIGDKTERALEKAGFRVDLKPLVSDSAGVAEALIQNAAHQSVLVVRANRGTDELPRRLSDAGIAFEQIPVYQSCDILTPDPAVIERLKNGSIDWVTVSSSAIARSTLNLFGDSLRHTKIVSISPATTRQLLELGFPPAAEATQYNMQGIVQAMEDWNNLNQR